MSATRDHTTPLLTTGVLLLAAGFSRRFGAVKLGATLQNGETVIARTLARIRATGAPLRIVTRPELQDLLLASGAGAEDLVLCTDAELGMGHTLAAGMRALPEWDACLVCLGDMPFIRTDTYARLLQALHGERITIPTYAGVRGNPVGFGAQWFASLRESTGDTGARDVVRSHPDSIDCVAVEDPAILKDIDTPEDLTRHQQS
jgi:molybdenum cofactor cytidylyltransferase